MKRWAAPTDQNGTSRLIYLFRMAPAAILEISDGRYGFSHTSTYMVEIFNINHNEFLAVKSRSGVPEGYIN